MERDEVGVAVRASCLRYFTNNGNLTLAVQVRYFVTTEGIM